MGAGFVSLLLSLLLTLADYQPAQAQDDQQGLINRQDVNRRFPANDRQAGQIVNGQQHDNFKQFIPSGNRQQVPKLAADLNLQHAPVQLKNGDDKNDEKHVLGNETKPKKKRKKKRKGAGGTGNENAQAPVDPDRQGGREGHGAGINLNDVGTRMPPPNQNEGHDLDRGHDQIHQNIPLDGDRKQAIHSDEHRNPEVVPPVNDVQSNNVNNNGEADYQHNRGQENGQIQNQQRDFGGERRRGDGIANDVGGGGINRNDGSINDGQNQPVWNNNNNFNNPNWNQPAPVQDPAIVDQGAAESNMKIMWDWSDFSLNFEQFVLPEQKVRRAPHGTTGQPWPMPQYFVTKEKRMYKLDKDKFNFKISKETCDIIEKAAPRYKEIIFDSALEDMYDNLQHAQGSSITDPSMKYDDELYTRASYISTVQVKIRRPCAKYPSLQSDESYDLFVKKSGSYILANEVWGALRGLETFSQLVIKGSDGEYYVKDTVINDYPRFPHRGVMVDSSRHYIFKEVIFDILEGMSQNKMNVMHWHIVDDQSFPYQSRVFPDLSEKGAFHPTFVYTHEDIAEIIEFARLRGIRVMPEFDTPGHTYSWGLSRPDLMTQCYQGGRPVNGYLGPLDPSKNETYRFLKTLFNEVLHVFKDKVLHLGGDEVPMTCWSSNPEVLKFLAHLEGVSDSQLNSQNDNSYMYSYDIRKVLEFYETRLTSDLKDIGRKRQNGVRFVMWQEIMNNNIQLPNDTIIQVWQGDMADVQRAISMGYQVLYSTCWYLDLIEYGVKWPKYYSCDPADTSMGYQIDESKVLGGEACLWAEYIDNELVMTTLWPRASAAAERLWSSKDLKDLDKAASRLQEHRCRMLSRGLGVGQISGPDYCLQRGKKLHIKEEVPEANCTSGRCNNPPHRDNLVEIERINLRVQQTGHSLADCSQILAHGGTILTVLLIAVVIMAIGFSLKRTGSRIVQIRMCKNKTIFIMFATFLLVYFMCYTSLWMQVMELKGSFEKRVRTPNS